MRDKSGHLRWRFIIGAVCLAVAVSIPAIALGATLTPVYRFYNTKAGTHFYTATEAERADVQNRLSGTYTFEGVAYNLETSNPQMNTPLHRFYNRITGTHFYTASDAEKNTVMATLAATYTYEGVAYNVSSIAAGNTPVYRFYNRVNGTHFYTASESERANVQATLSGTYTFEGAAFYLAYSGAAPTGDIIAPTTTSNAALEYRGPATVLLSATDNAGGSGVATTYYTIDGSAPIAGTSVSASGFGSHTIEFWSVDAAGNVEVKKVVTFAITSVHASPTGAVCADCHTHDLMTTHGNNCVYCHGTGITPSFVCSDCHNATNPFHGQASVAHDGSAQTCTDVGCHANDVSVIHDTMLSNGETPPSCDACHAAGVTPSTVCANCHGDFAFHHPAAGTAPHAVTGFCYTSGCHVTVGGSQKSDAAVLHNTWAKNPGCAACHAAGVTPTLTCFAAACHGAGGATVETTHAFAHANASGANSDACTACHGTDLPSVHNAVGCTCHTNTALNGLMAPLLAAGAAECVDCHAGGHAPHGFTGTGTVSASGHNTTALGRVGAYTKFNGEEGVTVRDSSGVIIQAEYPLPTQNVFWEAGDPEAPAGAITGLTWASEVTCEQCHTGLTAFEIEGPHGAQTIANVGIDPAFAGDYETAALWAFIAPSADGSIVTTDKVGGVPAPMAASGIVQYVPGGPNKTAPSAYALKTYLTATTSVPGPAVVNGADSVICAKCHDLHNPGTGHADAGVSVTNGDGYAHYHGHDYHDNPVAYAGLYQRSDETTYTAFMALSAGDTELKAASAGRGASGHCRNCHVAIPHAWKRPRLLVYETDPAPYNIGPSVTYADSAAEGRYYRFADYGTAHPEGGQLKGISSIRSPEMVHEGEAGEYVNWSGADGMTCQACGHHYAEPTPGSMWE